MVVRRPVPTVVDVLFHACAENLRVLRYVHAEGRVWKHHLANHIVHHSPCSAVSYCLKVQWASSVFAIVESSFTFEEAVAAIAYSVMCMDKDSLLLNENDRRDFINNSFNFYDRVVHISSSSKRRRDDSGMEDVLWRA